MYQNHTVLYDVIPLLSLTTSIIIMVITVSGFIYNHRCNRDLPDTSEDNTIPFDDFDDKIFENEEKIKKHEFKDRNYSF